MKKFTLLIFVSLLSICGYAQLAPEGFEAAWTGTPAAPPGWTVVNEQGPAVTWARSATGSTTQIPYAGSYAAYLDHENVSSTSPIPRDWLITPYFNMPANGLLRFYSRLTLTGDQGGIYKVKISTDADPSNLAAYTDLQTWTETSLNPIQLDYFEKVITLPAITGNVHIAFVMEGDNLDRWLIDEVKVVSQCFAPTNITATTPTLDGITLNWTNTGGAVSWNIEIVADNASPTGNGQIYNGQPPFNKTGLAPDTAYKAYVKAICSDQGTSEAVGPVFFNTAALGENCSNPLVIPPALPYSTTNNTANFADLYEGVAGTGCNATGNYLSGNDVVYSYTPATSGNININLSGTGTGAGIFIYSGCANIGTACIAGGTGNFNIPSLAVTGGTPIYIVISTTTTAATTPYTLTIQQVNCAAPTGLTATGPTGTSANLSWATGTATAWQMYVQNVGAGIPLAAGQNVTQNNVTVTQTTAGVAFTPATNYEYYLRSDCGDGTFSIWAGPYLFATTQIPGTLNYVQDWETTPYNWTIANGTQTNKWVVGTATSNGGTSSLYISNDNGLNNTYTNTAQSIVHAYRDLAIPAGVNQLNLAFDWKNIGESGWDYIRVYLVPATFTPTTGTQMSTTPAGGVKIGGDLVSGATWTSVNNVINAAAYAGTTMRLIFEWRNDTSGGSQPPAAVDNINLSIITCPAPTAPVISAGTLTSSQVIVNWTAPATAPASGYEYYVGATQTAPTGSTPVTGTSNTTSATVALTPSSSNYFWVRANCGPNDKSTWAGPLYFVAPQVPAAMDYVQNFDGPDPHGWALNNGTQPNKWAVGSATSNTAPNSLYISENNGTANTYNINATSVVQAYRDIQLPATLDQIELSFDWKNLGESAVDYFRVWLVPTSFTPTPGTQITAAASGGIQIGANFNQTTAAWANYSAIIQGSTYGGTARRLVFEWRNSATLGTQPPAAIDNINFKLVPCPQPSNLALSALTQTAATFTWTAPTSGVPGYEYYVSTSATPPANTAAASGSSATNTATINDLPTSTQHYIWVRSACSATSKSYWIGPVAFITPQVPAPMDYVQNFDNGPHGFQLVNGTQANLWVVGSAVSKSAPNSLYISNDNGVNNGYTLTSTSVVQAYRDITFPAAIDDAVLSFDWKNIGEANVDYFRVWLVPVDFNPTPGTQITAATGRLQIGGNFADSSVWTTSTTTFSATAYQGQTRRLIFEWRNSASGGTQPPAAIDNINLYKVTCPVPSNLAMTTNTPAGTSFTWTAPTSVTPTYDYYYSTSPTPPGTATTPSGNVATPAVTLSGLTDSTNYNIWVRSNCGTGSTSLWIGPIQFNTPQVASPLNYSQNFDGNAYGWSITNGTQVNKWTVGTATSNSPGKSMYISNTLGETNAYNTTTASVVHAYKDFIIPTGTTPLDFSFDWKNMGEINDYVRVWRVPTTFTPTPGTQITAAADRVLLVTPLYTKGTWTNSSTTIDPTSFAGTNIRIVFEWVNNTFTATQPPAAIDNIDFSVITCPRPTAQGVSAITQSGATFNWTEAGSAPAWEVYVVPAGQQSPTAATQGVNAGTNPYVYTTPELQPSTNYVYYVRSICSTTDKSKWTGPFPFRTAIANDECTGAYPLAVNAYGSECAVSATTSYLGATASAQPFQCGGVNGGDIWYSFVATSDRANIELSDFATITGAINPVVIALYQGEQCGSLVQLECSITNVLVAKNLVPGTTYRVRLYLNATPINQDTSFKICINTPAPPSAENQSACTVTTINYSFENPTPVPVVPPSPYPAMVNQYTVQGWRTTASDNIMEFWPSPNYEFVPAYDGNQFVELNANLVSGLYQDYATPESTVFTYSFAHRGRMGTDSCKLLAGPVGGPYVEVTTATTPNTGWQVYTGTYTSPSGQTTTRFIFQSASTYNGDGSVGNFLDAIEFSADNGVVSVTPSALTCANNTATVIAAGAGEWSAHADNPGTETVIANPESNTTTITGFTASGTYYFDWITQYCSSTIEVTYDNGNVAEPVTVTTVDYCVGATATPLTATALQDHTLNWYTVAQGGTADTTAPTPDTTINATTMYYVSQQSAVGCESPRVAITVTVHEVPAAPVAPVTAVTYCQDTAATPLVATVLAGNTLNWYTVATGGTASTTAPTPDTGVAATAAPISYFVSQISAAGCESPRTEIVVTVNPSIVPVTDFTYTVSTVCIEDINPVVIPGANFTTGGSYSGDAGLVINPATGEISLSVSTPGAHTVTYTVSPNPAQCNIGHSTAVQITITPLAVAETGFSYTTPVCTGTANQTAILNAGFTTGGTFTGDAGLSIDAATGEINVAASTAGTHTITYTVGQSITNCVADGTGDATIVITQQFTPVTGFDYDNSFCFGAADASPNLAADFTTGGTFTGTNGLVIDGTTGVVNVAASTSGEHTVTYTFAGDPANCISSGNASYTFIIGNELVFGFNGDCQGSVFIVTASPENGDFDNAVTFTWKTATGTIVGIDANTFNVSEYAASTPQTDVFPMEFFLTVNVNGCETTKSYTVDGISCTIQKGISPNNDGKNDFFDLTYMGVKKLGIFNRYGQEVYTKGNYKNEWKGQGSNGDELPTGTYYYVIERSAGGTETGWIYINRQE